MSPPSILIIGAGIAGPPLASFLLLSPLPASQLPSITIVERRAEDDHSAQALQGDAEGYEYREDQRGVPIVELWFKGDSKDFFCRF